MAGTRAQEDLVVRIRVDDARAKQSFKGLERQMNKFSGVNKKVRAGVKRTGDEVNKFSKTTKTTAKSTSLFSGALGGIGKTALGILGPLASITGAFFLLKSAFNAVINAGRFAEDTITTLGVAFGSEQKGVEAFKKALDFSVVTPFDPREVAAATELAVAFGIKDPFQKGVDGLADDVSLTQLAAGIAAFSADKDINNAMKNLLVPESEVIKRWGGEVMKIYRGILASGIKLGSDEFQQAWLEGLSRIDKFKNAANAASQTVTGLLSTIGGNIGNIALMFTGAAEGKDARTFWTFFRDILLKVNNIISTLVTKAQPFLIEIGAQLGGMFSDLFDIVMDLGKIAIPFIVGAFAPFLPGFIAVFAVFRGIIKVVKFLLDLLIRIVVANFKFQTGAKDMKKTFEGLGDVFRGILDFANDTFAIFELILKRFSQAVDNFIIAIETGGPFKAILEVLDRFNKIRNFIFKAILQDVGFNFEGNQGRELTDEQKRLGRQGGIKGKHGVDMVVPSGFADDTFPFRASSGERVTITPQAAAPARGGTTTINVVTTPENVQATLNNLRPISSAANIERESII